MFWPKCEVHTLKTLMNSMQKDGRIGKGSKKVIKRGMKKLQGSDQQYPQRKCQGKVPAINTEPQHGCTMRTFLKPGSVLAERFSRLYKLQK